MPALRAWELVPALPQQRLHCAAGNNQLVNDPEPSHPPHLPCWWHSSPSGHQTARCWVADGTLPADAPEGAPAESAPGRSVLPPPLCGSCPVVPSVTPPQPWWAVSPSARWYWSPSRRRLQPQPQQLSMALLALALSYCPWAGGLQMLWPCGFGLADGATGVSTAPPTSPEGLSFHGGWCLSTLSPRSRRGMRKHLG